MAMRNDVNCGCGAEHRERNEVEMCSASRASWQVTGRGGAYGGAEALDQVMPFPRIESGSSKERGSEHFREKMMSSLATHMHCK